MSAIIFHEFPLGYSKLTRLGNKFVSLYMGSISEVSFSWADLIKFLGIALGIALGCGVIYNKVDNLSTQITSTSLENKEYRLRIEKLELSMTKIELEIEQLNYDIKQNSTYYRVKPLR